MPGVQEVVSYLVAHGVPFEVQQHPAAYSAQEVAACEHVPGRDVAKVVMIEADERLVMLVVPATHRVNVWRVAELMGALDVVLAPESRFARTFADCEVGAMPPLGNLYDVPVFVDREVAEAEHLVFSAGTHTQSISMRTADFMRLVQPGVGAFAVPPRRRHAAAAAA